MSDTVSRDDRAGPGTASEVAPVPSMGLRDLVLFLFAGGISARWFPVAAEAGPSSLVIWLIGALAFQLPLALAVAELSARFPGEGGPYRWTHAVFGERSALLTGWALWACNVPYFPSLLYFAAGNLVFLGPPSLRALEGDPRWFIGFSLTALVATTWLNVTGMRRGKWLSNIGSMGTWLPVGLLVGLAISTIRSGHGATDFAAGPWLPDHGLRDLARWSMIAFAFGGLESAGMIAPEVRDPRRTVARGTLIAAALILGTYMIGTATMLVLLRPAEIGSMSGIMQAIELGAQRTGAPWLVPLFAVMIPIAILGGVSAWLTASARIPFAGGMEGLLPERLGRLHPKYGSPSAALWLMCACAGVVTVMGQAGQSVRGAYNVLVGMTTIMTFLPYLYIYAALIVAQRLPMPAGVFRIPGGRPIATLAAIIGLFTTSAAMLFALLPEPSETRPILAAAKILGLTVIGIGIGFALVRRRRP